MRNNPIHKQVKTQYTSQQNTIIAHYRLQ